jgi:branched-chain amino acid transport system substrate-binding protein
MPDKKEVAMQSSGITRRFLTRSGIMIPILLVGFFGAFIPGCQELRPIKVGFVGGLTGRNAALGVDGRDGVLLAFDEINEAGGIQGRSLELVIRDDLATPEGALAADQELIDEQVVAIIGHMTSETMMGAWPLVEQSGVVFFSPTVSTPQISGLDDNFFRLMPANTVQAEQLASYAIDKLAIASVVVFYDEDNLAYTLTYRDAFAEQFEALGGQILKDFPFSSATEPDFRVMLAETEALSPEAIFIVAPAIDTALIAQQTRLMGLENPILISNWALTTDLIQNGGQAVEGVLAITSHDENNQSPKNLEFIKRFQERYGRQPTFGAGYGYETALILAAALEKAKGQPKGLREALLETKDFYGIYNYLTLDEFGDVIRTVYLVTVKNGQFVTLSALGLPDNP